jgi:transketolase
LIVLYDDNHITIDGDTDLSFTEDVNARYVAYGWHVQTVADGNDIDAIRVAVAAAQAETGRPSIIKIRTIIGFGSTKQGTHGTHGAPLGAADIAHVKKTFSFDPEQSFVVLEDVLEYYRASAAKGVGAEADWEAKLAQYGQQHPELAADLARRMRGELPADWKKGLPTYSHTEAKAAATRNRSEEVLNALAGVLPELVGGSADLTGSNLTNLKCSGDFQKDTPAGRYIRFGVREHGMAAICNGMYAYGGLRPFCATFLNFIGYAMGSVRVSALSRFGLLYVMTHDSIGLGEDGPTHQPVEMLECLRALPNFLTMRPADGNETVGAYVVALERAGTPTCISLSRQAAPTVEGTSADLVAKGAYVILNAGAAKARPDLVLVSTGTELAMTVAVAKELAAELSVRVVSMPCCELFDEQPLDYQLEVFPEGAPVMSIEAGGINGWFKYAHAPFGMETYGASAPAGPLFNLFGFTVPNLTARAKEVVAFYGAAGAPSLMKYPRFPRLGLHTGH